MQTVQRLRPFTETIFAEVSHLALTHDAINLGQGFPDTDGPQSMLTAARQAIADGHNQYPPGPGIPSLRQGIAAYQLNRYQLDYAPDTEVLVTVGATEAIAGAVLGLVEPGDEVVLIEPYYDAYAATVAMAGGVRATVPLVPDNGRFALDLDALRATVTDRTRMIIVNSPHNPTGTVFTDDELAVIAEVCVAHDVIALTDEVYEFLTFDGRVHRPLAGFPGMKERTLRIAGAAKTFNVTGWKVGWISGPAELITATRVAKQYLTFVGSGPFQPAVALALDTELDWVSRSAQQLADKRTLLSTALREIGFDVHASEGTYFVLADPRPLGYHDGDELCRDIPARIGVAAVPVRPFVDHPEPWQHLVRFAFAKRDEVLVEAVDRLRRL